METRALSVLLLLAVVCSPTACSRPERVSPSARPTATSTATDRPIPTDTRVAPSREPTASPTAEPSRTPEPAGAATPFPLTLDLDEPSRTLESELGSGETASYLVRAREGQALELAVEASEEINLTWQDENGNVLLRSTTQETAWRGERPKTETSLIEIEAHHASHYTLTVTIASAPAEPSVQLLIPNGGEVWWEGSTQDIVWDAWGVETVDIEVASGGKPLGHVALGVDASSGQLSWDIPVGLVSNFGVAGSDAMQMRISSSVDPELFDQNDDPFTVQVPRIEFEPAATSATISGTLAADKDTYRYVLSASAGQTLEIDARPSELKVDVSGTSEGSAWQIPAGEDSLVIPALPATQDYFVTLMRTPPREGDSLEYTIDISID